MDGGVEREGWGVENDGGGVEKEGWGVENEGCGVENEVWRVEMGGGDGSKTGSATEGEGKQNRGAVLMPASSQTLRKDKDKSKSTMQVRQSYTGCVSPYQLNVVEF